MNRFFKNFFSVNKFISKITYFYEKDYVRVAREILEQLDVSLIVCFEKFFGLLWFVILAKISVLRFTSGPFYSLLQPRLRLGILEGVLWLFFWAFSGLFPGHFWAICGPFIKILKISPTGPGPEMARKWPGKIEYM